MRLEILHEIPSEGITLNTVKLDVKQLKNTATHLYIASNRWDSIYIELDEDIPCNMLKYISKQADTVEVSYPNNISDHVLKLLCEVYPEKSGAIRKCYMLKKDIREVLQCTAPNAETQECS